MLPSALVALPLRSLGCGLALLHDFLLLFVDLLGEPRAFAMSTGCIRGDGPCRNESESGNGHETDQDMIAHERTMIISHMRNYTAPREFHKAAVVRWNSGGCSEGSAALR